MPKRKSAKKMKAAESSVQHHKKESAEKVSLPMPAFLMQILAVILAGILIAALTLYVLGMMPARGFWTLAIILAIIAFVILPVMRKKFSGQA